MTSGNPSLQDPSLVPDEFDDNNHHLALALDHNTTAYEVFLQGRDVFPEEEKLLEERYGTHLSIPSKTVLTIVVARKDSRVLSDLEQRREKLLEIQTEWEQLKKSAVSLDTHIYVQQDENDAPPASF